MSGPLVSASAAFVAKNSRIPPFAIEQSLRFDGGGSKLVLSSPSSSYTTNKFTMSCWVKMGPIASDFRMMARDGAPNNVENVWCNFNAFGNNVIISYMYTASINGRQVLNTLGTQRDPSAWYHIVFGFDSSIGNTQRIWVNGVEQTTGKDTISGVAGFAWSSTYPFVIGGGTSHGYVAEYHFIDNTWLNSPNDFGAFDDEGVWRPIEYTGSHGTNGFYLKFDPTAANGIGHDHSGTGNHLTATGFTTSGTGTDVMSDTPTTNWCTANPLAETGSNVDILDGNLVVNATASGDGAVDATIAVPSSSKFYVEATLRNITGGINQFRMGLQPTNDVAFSRPGTNTDSYGFRWNDSAGINASYDEGTETSYGTGTAVDGDIVGITIDRDNGEIKAHRNNTYFNSGNAVITGIPATGDYLFRISVDGGAAKQTGATLNFGQREFAYPPGTSSATAYFNTVTYTGSVTDTSTQAVTGVGFQSDLVWIKRRDANNSHQLVDFVRGAGKWLESNSTNAESSTNTNGVLTSFDSDGFTLTGGSTNANLCCESGATYVAWCWKAGGTASSNTDGTITSSVSANQDAGFSIVSYTGNGTSGATVGHGLGVKPSFLIVRRRPTTSNWTVYHSSVGATKRLVLDSTVAATAGTGFWNDTEPTSTVFTIGNDGGTNSTTNNTYIAYCFAEKEGVTKVGSYTGTGSTQFIECGFKPAMVIMKSSANAREWIMKDTARGDGDDKTLEAHEPNSEALSEPVGYQSNPNGFTLVGNSVANVNGDSLIFIAFAENFSADTDYKALNSANLPAPTVKDGSDYFDTTLEPGGLVYGPASGTSPAGTQSRYYGKYVQDSNLNSSYPAFQWANALDINGKTDWYIPAIQELDIIYSNLKPTTEANVTSDTRDSWNSNPYAVPARTTDYSSSSGPSQTSATSFQEGGSQAFSRGDYYTVTQHAEYYGVSPTSFVMFQKFNNGDVWANGKQNTLATWRAIRRVTYTGSEPAIGASYEGGYFAGLISTTADSSATHALIVAPREYGERGTDPVLLAQQNGFTDALWWVKSRSDAQDHKLLDVVRGNYVNLRSNTTDQEQNYIKPGYSSVVWSWKAGGTGSTNTAGTITSTVSANPSAGFSIGTYTADGTNTNKTVGHGLGVAPEFIIVKNRDTTGRHWLIWHKDFNDNDKAALFTADAPADNRFGPSAPTSTVFGLYGGQGNYNSDDHVFYAFAGVEGYSKFGSYTGNGNPDGPFVYCGFRPAMVIIKNTSAAANWIIRDSARSPYNKVHPSLYPNTSDAEINNFDMDFLSNGFKMKDDNIVFNTSGSTYIFVALAENPFGGSGVNPATAR